MNGVCALAIGFVLVCHPLLAIAGDVSIEAVDVRARGADQFDFAVTLRHGDSGWDHYANQWQIISPSGDVLATRTLAHPHVDEQPFTRSLSGVGIDRALRRVSIVARDSVHGQTKKSFAVDLPGR